MRSHLTHLISSTILALSVTFSQAQTIGVNFAEDTGGQPRENQTLLPGDLAGAPGYESTNWNNVLVFAGGTATNLNDNSGTSTSMSVSWITNNGWGDGTANTDANSGIPNAKLQRGYLDDTGPNSTATFNVSNIPYSVYDLVVYFSSDDPGMEHGDFTVNGNFLGRTGTIVSWADNPTLEIGRNVLLVEGLTGSSLEFIGDRIGGQTRGSISGFQIVNIPEPSAAVLGLVLVAGLAARRRK